MNQQERDFVAVAERFLGVPYLWGGKTSLGLDCSALVQLVADAPAARPARATATCRSSRSLPPIEPAADLSNLQRGDLMFWKGHVAIVRDTSTLIHANAFHMAVAIEPIAEAVARIRAAGSEISSVRRLELALGSIAAAAIDHVFERHADLEPVDLPQDVRRRSRAATTARRCAA